MCRKLLIFCLLLSALGAPLSYADPGKAGPVLTINGIEEFVRANKILSIEDLLPYLPASYLSHYTLVFNSRSLQSSNLAFPRALIFGTNAKLVMSFNGSPDEKAYNSLEMFEFNELSKTFQLEEIEFPAEHSGSDQVVFSQKNPERCIKCHSPNPHPLWDAPPLWPGSFGEAYHEKLSKTEADGLYAYLALQPNHPRYKYLKNTQIYTDEGTFYPSRHNVYVGVEIDAPNAQLSKLLTTLNNEKIIRQIETSARFEEYKYALLASVSSTCNNVLTYFPQGWKEQLSGDYAGFVRQDDIYLHRQMERKRQRSVTDMATSTEVNRDNSLRDLRYVAERGLGLDTSEWSMALEKNAPDFTALEPIKLMMEKKLIGHISAQDKEIMTDYYFRNYPGNNRYCAYLEKRSTANLAALDSRQALTFRDIGDTVQQQTGASGQQLTMLCATCHTTGVAPKIEFDKPELLAERLNQPYATHGTLLNEILFRISPEAGARRMPPTVNFSGAELETLNRYFKDLAAH